MEEIAATKTDAEDLQAESCSDLKNQSLDDDKVEEEGPTLLNNNDKKKKKSLEDLCWDHSVLGPFFCCCQTNRAPLSKILNKTIITKENETTAK